MLEDEEDDGFLSVLIGLDLAGHQVGARKGFGSTQKKKGTKVFMAIGVLYGEEHSFMHDLESFFWVLFLVCVDWNWARQNQESRVT